MVRTQKNGSFFSVVELMEKYDNIWRANHGYGDWAMYKVDAGSLRTYRPRRPWRPRATWTRRHPTTVTTPTPGS